MSLALWVRDSQFCVYREYQGAEAISQKQRSWGGMLMSDLSTKRG